MMQSKYFDPLRLVNQMLGAGTPIVLGDFQKSIYLNLPFSKTRVTSRHTANITQYFDADPSMEDSPLSVRFGTINITRGEIREGNSEEPKFEKLVLTIDHGFTSRGREIDPLRIVLYSESPYRGEDTVQRHDRIYTFGPFWKTTNLTDVLPTDWFLNPQNRSS